LIFFGEGGVCGESNYPTMVFFAINFEINTHVLLMYTIKILMIHNQRLVKESF